MIVIKKDPLARRTRIRLSVLPGLRQGRHRPPGVVLTFTFLSPTDVTALRNSSICRGAQNHLLCGRLRVPDELSQPRKPASTRVRCRPQPPPGQGWGPKRWRGGDPGRTNTRVDTLTSVHTQTDHDNIFLRISSRATLDSAACTPGWTEKRSLVCCPRPRAR
uniref:uncharacterized protein LOC118555147 isoform X2 n=1 Tax=Halichoerus grypus TaxID=9711 RepID=UPI001659F381|nr:uncharacterized protein LOC118555147 isoform X2 [Halichoerus grypus]